MRFLPIACAMMLAQLAFAQPTPPELPAVLPTPASLRVDSFRMLLAMTPVQREAEYARRKSTPQDRQVLEGKILEFEKLTPEQREARLLALQRQLDFRLLIRLPASNRTEITSQLSEADRTWQTERLAQWDKVPADLQSMILTNLKVLSYLFPESTTTPSPSALSLPLLPQAQRDAMEKAVAAWNQLPEDKRRAISNHFCAYFTLDDRKRSDVLQPLSPNERRLMEQSLEKFNQLSRGEQARSMAGFQKFASLSPQERQEFLRSAEQWQKMSQQDRQLWRQLVNQRLLMPPSPPGMLSPAPPEIPPMPPSPPSSAPRRSLPLAGTNR